MAFTFHILSIGSPSLFLEGLLDEGSGVRPASDVNGLLAAQSRILSPFSPGAIVVDINFRIRS